MKSYLLPIGVIAIVVGAVAGGVLLSNQEPPQGVVMGAEIQDTDHRLGNPDAKVELIEYGDFQCPACASYEPVLERLVEEHGDWINFAYRHFPLKEIHRNATKASFASEAAHLQNKFWEYKEMLYQKQGEWKDMPDPDPKFVQYARELGLNEEQFVRDMESDAVQTKVDSDYQTGLASGFNSTPTLVVNGKKIANPSSYDQLVELLKERNAQ